MRAGEGRVSLAASSLGLALLLLGGAAALAGAMQIGIFIHSGVGPWWAVVCYPVCGLVYVAAGLVAWWLRSSNRLGAIMVFGGLSWLAASLINAGDTVLTAAGTVLATVPLAVVVQLLLAFPSGRLRSPLAAWTVGFGYVISLVLQVPQYLFSPQAGGVLAIADRPGLVTAGFWLQAAGGAVDVTVAVVILASRMRRATRRQRQVLGPLYLYGIAALLFIPFAGTVLPLWHFPPGAIGALQVAVLTGVPVAFAVAILLGGFARTSEIQELGAWLGGTVAAQLTLTEAVARALGDESVRLAYRGPGPGGYLDAAGRPVELPADGSGRAAVGIELGGERIGVIIYDAVLIGDAELVRAAGRIVAMAVAHERLDAELQASQRALQESRARLVEAADRERRRIAQNLHDGLQMKLVLPALEAQQLARRPGASPAVVAAATTLRSRIDAAAGELRELVHAVMPAPLIERGLGAAAQDLVDRMPLPTQLDLGVNGNIPQHVSATAYFVVAEALANAVKHARASSLAVRLACERDTVVVEVADDGIGGAAAGQGLGLRSLADRVDVLGGSLRIDSPAGAGTRVVAELPCRS